MLAAPAFLWGLLLLPLLPAIYLLRQRVKRMPVSSLLLWRQQRQSPEGGRKLDRLRTPLLFFLELAALALLLFAAADPLITRSRARRPVVFVLDDSLSMNARSEGTTPRERAGAALRAELSARRHEPVRLVLAGLEPQALGEPSRGAAEALAQLSSWRAGVPSAALLDAALFARRLGGPRARIVVLTDEGPPDGPAPEWLEWWAFGRPLANAAIVNAARISGEGKERALLEVAAYAGEAVDTELAVEPGGARTRLRLVPGERQRLVLELGAKGEAFRARLGGDALAADDEVLLLPAPRPPLRVDVRLADPGLRGAVERALRASGRAELGAREPQLVVGAAGTALAEPGAAWTLELLSAPGAGSFTGPFVVDRRHPLAAGLSLDGVIWSAAAVELPGVPVIAAGNVTLLADREAGARHELTLQLVPKLSTLSDTPAWPSLLWNLLEWRAAKEPGPREVNARLGAEVVTSLPLDAPELAVLDPAGRKTTLRAQVGVATFRALSTGVHRLEAGPHRWSVSVNALSAGESDLTRCASGRWGEGTGGAVESRRGESAAWLLLLSGLAVLAAHRRLTARQPAAAAA